MPMPTLRSGMAARTAALNSHSQEPVPLDGERGPEATSHGEQRDAPSRVSKSYGSNLKYHAGRPSKVISNSKQLQDLKSRGQLLAQKFIKNQLFECIMACIIGTNFVMIIIEANVTAEKPNGEHPDAPLWIQVGGWLTLVIFVLELVLRLYVERSDFFLEGWNTFDFSIITLDVTCSLLGLIVGNAIPVSALRVMRLAKLARVSKVFRIFPELRLMVAGLIGCLRSIFWGLILLLFALLVWAVIGVQFIHPLNLKIVESGLYERTECDRCPRAYDSVEQSALTLLQEAVQGDEWGTVTVPLIEMFPASAVYFIGVMMTVSMALLNLILGVVVNVAMQSRDDMAAMLEREKVTHRVDASGFLEKLCHDMDSDESGQLSKEELLAGFQENEAFKKTLADLGIEEDDLEILWTILDPDRDGCVPFETFIHKSFSMKESDTQFMLAYIKYYVTKIRDQVMQGQAQLKQYMMGTRAELTKFEHQIDEQLSHQTFHAREEFHDTRHERSEISEDSGNGGLRVASSTPGLKRPEACLRLAVDDRRILDEILEKSKQWRNELTASIDGVRAKLDSLDPYTSSKNLSQQLIVLPSANKKKVWCTSCDRDSQPESARERVVGRSIYSGDAVPV